MMSFPAIDHRIVRLTNVVSTYIDRLRAFVLMPSCLGMVLIVTSTVSAQNVSVGSEYNVKAASLYAFGRYVTWPPSSFPNEASPFVIGVFGANHFGTALDEIAAKKKIQGRSIQVRQMGSIAECADCHLLFVSSSVNQDDEQKLLAGLNKQPVLIVGESPGFALRGGVIGFVWEGANVRFELNVDEATQTLLSVDAKMLSLGKRVGGKK